MTNAVQQVVVHGGGVAAAMAALAGRRAEARLGPDVIWVETGEAPAPHAAAVDDDLPHRPGHGAGAGQ